MLNNYQWIFPKKFSLFFTLCACVTILFYYFAPVTHAEVYKSDVRYKDIEIQLWPEYDQQSVWVGCTMLLAEDTPIPAQIELRIPTSVGNPNVISIGPNKDYLFEVPYQRIVDGEWSFISFKTTEPLIRMEYEDQNLTINNTYRDYQFVWFKDNYFENIYLQIQQPYGVRTMNIIPLFPNSSWFSDEVLSYFSAMVKANEVDNKLVINISYQKQNNEVTINSLEVRSNVPIDDNTNGRINSWNSFPWLALIPITMFLIIIGGFGYWNFDGFHVFKWLPFKLPQFLVNEEKSKADKNKRNELIIHCPQCGNQVYSKDHYCRVCGSPL